MTPTEFKIIFPAFEGEAEPRVQYALDSAAPFFDVTRWDDLYLQGLANYAAHTLTMTAVAAVAVGGVAGVSDIADLKKVGDVSVQKSEIMLQQQAKDPFMRTIYGQEYRRLARLVGMGVIAV
jgi:hypothetical protein